jgi:hypothetical protein
MASLSEHIMDSGLKLMELPVSEGFRLPTERLLTDPDFVENVITTGVSVVQRKEELEAKQAMDEYSRSLFEQYDKQIEDLKKEFEKKERKYGRYIEEREEEIARKVSDIQKLQQELHDITTTSFESGRLAGRRELEELLEREKKELHERKEELKEKNREIAHIRAENKHEMERLREEKDKKMQGVLEGMENVQNLFKKGGKGKTSGELGSMGEIFVKNQIESDFNPANIEYVSAEAHSADLLFEHEGISILIEAKNHGHHMDKVSDLKKFHDDIELHSKKGYPKTAALLVSLYDIPLIHGYRTCYFEVRHGMPVIYIGGALDKPILIQAALHLLVKIAKNSKFCSTDNASEESADEQFEKAIEAHRGTAVRFMVMVRKMQDEINLDRRAHDEQLVRLNARERSLAEFVTYQSELAKQFSGIDEDVRASVDVTVGGSSGKKVVNKEAVLAYIREKGGNVSETMLQRDWGLTRATLKTKLGAGIRELKALAMAGGGGGGIAEQQPPSTNSESETSPSKRARMNIDV